jgi:UDP-N-acetylglucosamine 3-dehydrogenase
VGFRALFERASFDHRAVFESDGPPKSTFMIFNDKAQGAPVLAPPGNPYQVGLQRFVDCINGRADPDLLDVERAIEALMLSAATQRALAD